MAPEIKMPLNFMAVPDLPPAKELKALGVRRLTAGTGIPQTIWGRVAELAKDFLTTGSSKPMTDNDNGSVLTFDT
jgi:2-methylisocitrate lyase-like PEP mutase family enzyme